MNLDLEKTNQFGESSSIFIFAVVNLDPIIWEKRWIDGESWPSDFCWKGEQRWRLEVGRFKMPFDACVSVNIGLRSKKCTLADIYQWMHIWRFHLITTSDYASQETKCLDLEWFILLIVVGICEPFKLCIRFSWILCGSGMTYNVEFGWNAKSILKDVLQILRIWNCCCFFIDFLAGFEMSYLLVLVGIPKSSTPFLHRFVCLLLLLFLFVVVVVFVCFCLFVCFVCFCFVLFLFLFFALFCFVLFCFVLFCFVLFCFVSFPFFLKIVWI